MAKKKYIYISNQMHEQIEMQTKPNKTKHDFYFILLYFILFVSHFKCDETEARSK